MNNGLNPSRLLSVALLLAVLTFSACQSHSAPAPNPESTSEQPGLSAAPAQSGSSTSEQSASDGSILGEWAGYVSLAEYGFAYSEKPTYAAKLTISEDSAWLSLDLLATDHDFTANLPKKAAPASSFGANLSVTRLSENFVSLKIDNYAYQQHESVPFKAGSTFQLSCHRFASQEERIEAEILQHTPAYVEIASNDLLFGRLEDWTISLARLADSPGTDFTYPFWYGFKDLKKGVRGAYGFGERGADNDFSTLVFVYDDENGFEHIRFLFGEFSQPESLADMGCFVANWPMNEYGVSFSATPWWRTIYTLDTRTGEFLDVSEQHQAFYRDEMLPDARMSLCYQLYAHQVKGEAQSEWRPKQLEDMQAFYALVYEAAYGKHHGKPPKPKAPVVNSKTAYADLDGDGGRDTVQVMFFNSKDEDSKDYNAAWFCVNGNWRYYVLLGNLTRGDVVTPDFAVVDIDRNMPGVEIAFEVNSDSGPRVRLYRVYDYASMAYVCNSTLWGSVLDGQDDLRIMFPGDGTATGFRRSHFSRDIIVQYGYSSNGGFLNLDLPEDGLFKAQSQKTLILTELLGAYLERDTFSKPIELPAHQQIVPLASDEDEWLKLRTLSGQILWVHCQSDADGPKFK